MTRLRHLEFRVPFGAEGLRLGEVLARAWPEGSAEDRERVLETGAVEVDERIVRDDSEVRPGATIEADVDLEGDEYGMPDTEALERGDGWVVVDKPRGMPGRLAPDGPMHPIYFLADRLGIDRETFTPVWPMPTTSAGPWLFGRTRSDAEQLRRRWREGSLMTTWLVLVPRPDVPEGTLETPDGFRMQYSATKIEEGLAELQVTVARSADSSTEELDPAAALRRAFAEEGTPIVGDRTHGGFMTSGGLRLRLAALFDSETDLQYSWQPPEDWWPVERLLPEQERPRPEPVESIDELDLPELTVKPAALERLREGGHPWIRPTDVAGRQDHLRPGTLVRTRGTNDVYGPVALVDGRVDVAARVWSDDPLDAIHFEETVDYRVDRAIARRAPFFRAVGETDFFRLIHGEADRLPGIAVDRVGPILRATVDGGAADAYREELYDALRATDPSTMIVEVEAGAAPGRDRGDGIRLAREGARYGSPDRPLVVREKGLKYLSNPWEPVQRVDPSHRTTRGTVRRAAEGAERWLVATAPTTALPIPLADAGCEAISYAAPEETAGIDKMLELNGLDTAPLDRLGPDSLVSALQRAESTYDGIVLDLGLVHRFAGEQTTAADLVVEAIDAALPGANLIVFRAPLPDRPALEATVSDALEAAGIDGVRTTDVDPPADFPASENFPEGLPYEGLRLDLDTPSG